MKGKIPNCDGPTGMYVATGGDRAEEDDRAFVEHIMGSFGGTPRQIKFRGPVAREIDEPGSVPSTGIAVPIAVLAEGNPMTRRRSRPRA
jgi:hypothetical protein